MSRPARKRWLPRFPNYERAHAVDEVEAGISERDFLEQYVDRHRPCIIRGGVSHWPAVGKWSAASLRSALGSTDVRGGVGIEPLVEYSFERFKLILKPIKFDQFFDLAESGEHPRVQLYAERLTNFSAVAGDVGDFKFLDLKKHPARVYRDRVFMSRSGYTDWHTHTADESLTAQVLGSKELLMLPPDSQTHEVMLPMAKCGVWKVPRLYWPEKFAALVPYRAVLHPGDVVFIPMHWWHAVESVDEDLNVTVAKVFRTPVRWLSDLRLPNARASLGINLVTSVWASVASRSPAPLATMLRLLGLTAVGFPRSLKDDKTWERRP